MLIPMKPADIERECLDKIRFTCAAIVKDIDEGKDQEALTQHHDFLTREIKKLRMLKEMGCVRIG